MIIRIGILYAKGIGIKPKWGKTATIIIVSIDIRIFVTLMNLITHDGYGYSKLRE